MPCILAISNPLTWLPAATQASDLELTVSASQVVLQCCQLGAGGSACEWHLSAPPLTVGPTWYDA